MFSRILIANRGEIALRVIRTCRRMGIGTVAVYSEADEDSLHVRLADESIKIGPAESGKSYLNISSIISAAEIADVDAIHPGYGFLSENAHFAEVCQSCKIEFIGPSPEAMALLGNKVKAKEVARSVGVPVIPGSPGAVADQKEAIAIAAEIGYPVIIKAAMGGGGRGMRVAHNEVSLKNGFFAAQREAENAFKDGTLYIEKLIEHPRHVEAQVIGDKAGNVIFLGERDCSIQRRKQKLLEEAPSPVVDEKTRSAIGAAAVALLRKVGYYNAATVEFLYDAPSREFYFMEVNTRLQVEHPVTEMITGLDLVALQIRVANGEKLPFRQEDVRNEGWAIECRINAENPDKNFAPNPGTIKLFIPPHGEGVRLDSHCYSGYRIPPNYDSLIGKLIVKGRDRAEAILNARRALDEFFIEGIPTTIGFHKRLLKSDRFASGRYDIHFVEQEFNT
ncbi:MAG: acetyl-CoA carboxylase biotin carboxylase subunit [Planctomycetota bacterium]